MQPGEAMGLQFALEWLPHVSGKACKIVSIELLQLPPTRLPKRIFHPFLTQASVKRKEEGRGGEGRGRDGMGSLFKVIPA